MIPLPPNPDRGYPILDWARSAQETMRRSRPIAGPGIRITESTGGTVISSVPSAGAESTAAPLPWDISLTGVGDPVTSYAVKVWPGLLSGHMPGNMFEALSASASAAAYLVATVTTDGRGVVSTLLSIASSPPTPPAPSLAIAPTTVGVLLGIILDGVTYNLWGRNVSVQSREVLREDKASAGPHELPYQSWWGWNVY